MSGGTPKTAGITFRLFLWPVLFAFDTAGQLCLKHGSAAAAETAGAEASLVQLARQALHAAANPWIWAGIACLLASFLTWLLLLRWNPLSRAFTIASLSYVTVFLASWALLHEPIRLIQAAGVAAVLAGIILIGAEEKG